MMRNWLFEFPFRCIRQTKPPQNSRCQQSQVEMRVEPSSALSFGAKEGNLSTGTRYATHGHRFIMPQSLEACSVEFMKELVIGSIRQSVFIIP
jgi:hypothetical protein